MYDVFIIGAGPGGYGAAIRAAKTGLKVAIAEADVIGGICTNKGCIPTKAYIESVNLLKQIKTSKRFGINVEGVSFNLSSLNKRKDRIVSRLVKGVEYLLKENDVKVYSSKTTITAPGKVKIGQDIIEAGSIIVATGSKPKVPTFMDVPGIWTSDNVFTLKGLPTSLLIVGGGVIGIEMADIFASLGVHVTIVEAMDRILPAEDREVSKEIERVYRDIDIFTSSKVSRVSGNGPFTAIITTPKGDRQLNPQSVLCCIGRAPNLPKELIDMGVCLNKAGGIAVNEHMETSVKGIYAVGDVTGEYMLAHVALKEGVAAARNIAGEDVCMDYRTIPSVIFTHPEIASVGALSDELTGEDCKTGMFPVSALGRARTMEANTGFARVVATQDGKIKRVTIMAPHATELISWAALAIDQGLTIDEFLSPAYPHPTMAELVREASEDILGFSIHKP
ncbi:MAG: dihydrolipoyl dehydrogenase [Thermodesulfobacteriota bacterium]|nr:dihydrolipoyl dehydrogenase [Thermodesulfobacteriota bacterium]